MIKIIPMADVEDLKQYIMKRKRLHFGHKNKQKHLLFEKVGNELLPVVVNSIPVTAHREDLKQIFLLEKELYKDKRKTFLGGLKGINSALKREEALAKQVLIVTLPNAVLSFKLYLQCNQRRRTVKFTASVEKNVFHCLCMGG